MRPTYPRPCRNHRSSSTRSRIKGTVPKMTIPADRQRRRDRRRGRPTLPALTDSHGELSASGCDQAGVRPRHAVRVVAIAVGDHLPRRRRKGPTAIVTKLATARHGIPRMCSLDATRVRPRSRRTSARTSTAPITRWMCVPLGDRAQRHPPRRREAAKTCAAATACSTSTEIIQISMVGVDGAARLVATPRTSLRRPAIGAERQVADFCRGRPRACLACAGLAGPSATLASGRPTHRRRIRRLKQVEGVLSTAAGARRPLRIDSNMITSRSLASSTACPPRSARYSPPSMSSLRKSSGARLCSAARESSVTVRTSSPSDSAAADEIAIRVTETVIGHEPHRLLRIAHGDAEGVTGRGPLSSMFSRSNEKLPSKVRSPTRAHPARRSRPRGSSTARCLRRCRRHACPDAATPRRDEFAHVEERRIEEESATSPLGRRWAILPPGRA